MKAAAMILIIAASTIVGMGLRFDIVKRLRFLKAFESALISIRSELSFKHTDTENVLKSHINDKYCGVVFERCFCDITVNKRPRWTKWLKYTCLNDEDIEAFSSLNEFGASDISGQIAIIDDAKEKISHRRDIIENELGIKGKMYVSCAFLMGCAISITII